MNGKDINLENRTFKKLSFVFFNIFLVSALALLIFSNISIVGCSDDDDDPDPTPTRTPTPLPTATPTETPFVGWGTEEAAGPDGHWLDLASNANGELCLAYYYAEAVGYTTRSVDGTWSSNKVVDASQNNVYGQNFYIRTSIDDNGDLHFSWTPDRASTGVCWNSIDYNRWDAATSSWAGVQTVMCEEPTHCTLAPDMVTTTNPARRFIAGQYFLSVGFNWDYGSGFKPCDQAAEPWYDEYAESGPRFPHLSIGVDGLVHCLFGNYKRWGGDAQLGFFTFNPNTNSFSAIELPHEYGPPHYPGFSDIFASKDGASHAVWFVWHSGVELNQLYYARRDPNGTWSDHIIVEDYGTTAIYDEEAWPAVMFPCVAVNDAGVALVVFTVRNHIEERIYYSIKRPSEGSFSEPKLVTTQSDKQGYPSVTVQGDMFYIAWRDSRGPIYMNYYAP